MTTEELILGEIRVMRAEWREDITRLHEKNDLTYQQALRTNGRVTKLEENHKACPVLLVQKDVEEIKTSKKYENTKEYKAGHLVYTLGVAILAIGSFVFSIYSALKK